MSDTTPAPVPPPVVLTRTMKTTRTIWMLSIGCGVVALACAFLYRQLQLENLRAIVLAFAPDRAASTVDAVANVVFWGSLGALTAVILFEVILLRSMLRRHGTARIGLVLLVVVNVAVALVAETFLAEPGLEGALFSGFLLAQVALAAVALLTGFLPGAHRFFRSGAQADRPTA